MISDLRQSSALLLLEEPHFLWQKVILLSISFSSECQKTFNIIDMVTQVFLALFNLLYVVNQPRIEIKKKCLK